MALVLHALGVRTHDISEKQIWPLGLGCRKAGPTDEAIADACDDKGHRLYFGSRVRHDLGTQQQHLEAGSGPDGKLALAGERLFVKPFNSQKLLLPDGVFIHEIDDLKPEAFVSKGLPILEPIVLPQHLQTNRPTGKAETLVDASVTMQNDERFRNMKHNRRASTHLSNDSDDGTTSGTLSTDTASIQRARLQKNTQFMRLAIPFCKMTFESDLPKEEAFTGHAETHPSFVSAVVLGALVTIEITPGTDAADHDNFGRQRVWRLEEHTMTLNFLGGPMSSGKAVRGKEVKRALEFLDQDWCNRARKCPSLWKVLWVETDKTEKVLKQIAETLNQSLELTCSVCSGSLNLINKGDPDAFQWLEESSSSEEELDEPLLHSRQKGGKTASMPLLKPVTKARRLWFAAKKGIRKSGGLEDLKEKLNEAEAANSRKKGMWMKARKTVNLQKGSDALGVVADVLKDMTKKNDSKSVSLFVDESEKDEPEQVERIPKLSEHKALGKPKGRPNRRSTWDPNALASIVEEVSMDAATNEALQNAEQNKSNGTRDAFASASTSNAKDRMKRAKTMNLNNIEDDETVPRAASSTHDQRSMRPNKHKQSGATGAVALARLAAKDLPEEESSNVVSAPSGSRASLRGGVQLVATSQRMTKELLRSWELNLLPCGQCGRSDDVEMAKMCLFEGCQFIPLCGGCYDLHMYVMNKSIVPLDPWSTSQKKAAKLQTVVRRNDYAIAVHFQITLGMWSDNWDRSRILDSLYQEISRALRARTSQIICTKDCATDSDNRVFRFGFVHQEMLVKNSEAAKQAKMKFKKGVSKVIAMVKFKRALTKKEPVAKPTTNFEELKSDQGMNDPMKLYSTLEELIQGKSGRQRLSSGESFPLLGQTRAIGLRWLAVVVCAKGTDLSAMRATDEHDRDDVSSDEELVEHSWLDSPIDDEQEGARKPEQDAAFRKRDVEDATQSPEVPRRQSKLRTSMERDHFHRMDLTSGLRNKTQSPGVRGSMTWVPSEYDEENRATHNGLFHADIVPKVKEAVGVDIADLGFIPTGSMEFRKTWPLHHFAWENDVMGMEAALATGSKRLASITDRGGRSCLHVAAARGSIGIVDVLIKRHAELNIQVGQADQRGWAPLHYASAHGHDVVVASLSKGLTPADINAVIEESGDTALTIAARAGFSEVARCLLLLGANASVANKRSFTALHEASVLGHQQVAIELLAADADPNIIDRLERSPLHWAALYQHTHVVEVLLKAGAKATLKTSTGDSAVEWGRRATPTPMLQMLEESHSIELKTDFLAFLSEDAEEGEKMVEPVLRHKLWSELPVEMEPADIKPASPSLCTWARGKDVNSDQPERIGLARPPYSTSQPDPRSVSPWSLSGGLSSSNAGQQKCASPDKCRSVTPATRPPTSMSPTTCRSVTPGTRPTTSMSTSRPGDRSTTPGGRNSPAPSRPLSTPPGKPQHRPIAIRRGNLWQTWKTLDGAPLSAEEVFGPLEEPEPTAVRDHNLVHKDEGLTGKLSSSVGPDRDKQARVTLSKLKSLKEAVRGTSLGVRWRHWKQGFSTGEAVDAADLPEGVAPVAVELGGWFCSCCRQFVLEGHPKMNHLPMEPQGKPTQDAMSARATKYVQGMM